MSHERPKVVCFICDWASTEEKLSTIRTRKVSDVDIIQMPCIGGLDPVMMFEIFMKGADGILLIGCSPLDCHFIEGSNYAEFTINVLKKLLSFAGLAPQRLELHLLSPIEEVKFSRVIEDFVTKLEKLESPPLVKEQQNANVLENVLAARNAVADFRLRAFMGKELELVKRVNVYRERLSREEFTTLLDDVVRAEFIRHKILLLVKKKPFSVKELAQLLNMKPAIVFRHILNMRREGMIALDSIEGTTPLYRALEVQ